MIYSISVNFKYPLLLLILIPFVLLTFIPYFRLSKKYRKTRNRISSMILHLIVSLMVTFLLSGLTFISSKSNLNNEIMIVVDKSDSSEIADMKRDMFIETLVDYAKYENIQVGIVTFGYDQEYAVPFTRKYDEIMDIYHDSILPDTKATNIAQALVYSKDLLTPESNSKMVVVSDFVETDENVRTVIKSIAQTGVKIDTAYINTDLTDEMSDIEIVSSMLPEYHISKGDTCAISVDVYSNTNKSITIRMKDNGETQSDSDLDVDVVPGLQTVTFTHTFLFDGLHALDFEILDGTDTVKDNDKYTSYLNVETFNRLLIIEHCDESELLKSVLTENDLYKVDVINALDDNLPSKTTDLCKYDEIILNNIAVNDLPDGFEDLLYEYVNVYGGGLLTTGGQDEFDSELSHAYNRDDLSGTTLHKMLPVQAINYTPPLGVMIIIDTSGSMEATSNGSSLLEWAKAGAVSCLNSMSERDYIGVMTLEDSYNTVLPLTPKTQTSKILRAIDSIEIGGGGTEFAAPIERAGQALRALKSVDRKHIIIVSDGETPQSDIEAYEKFAKIYYDSDKITISVVGVNISTAPTNRDAYENESVSYETIGVDSAYKKMVRLTKIGHGRLYITSNNDASEIITNMREDLNAKDIKELNFEDFYPQATMLNSNIFKDIKIINDDTHVNSLPFTLSGFHGVKIKANADLIINGEFNVPILAEWKQGKGSVGSLMVDLNGNWSSEMLLDENGKQLIYNIINSLSPVESIRPNDISLAIREDNYLNYLSIYTSVNEGERIEAEVVKGESIVSLNNMPENTDSRFLRELPVYPTLVLSADSNYSRCSFVIREPGVYTINVNKYDKDNNIIGTNTIYKEFAYSKEYNYFEVENENKIDEIKQISLLGNGEMIEDIQDPQEVIDSFTTILLNEYDPRTIFEIIAIVAFLLDIAVRKFKFLWPHEIYKKYKERKIEK